MLKSRNTLSYIKINKRPIRPLSSGTYFQRKPRPSLQINHIIDSLQKNVKELKHYCNKKEQTDKIVLSHEKSKNGFISRKILQRNSTQSNLQKHICDKNQQKIEDKSLTDIFEIRSFFMKINGRETNNIIELYEFYKKNVEKREKSTRIMASIDMSNPNMGLSIDVGKQSLLKHENLLNNKREIIQASKIEEKQEDISKIQSLPKIPMKKGDKPSQLAIEMLSKGYYNLSNVANLLNNKKYRLTRQKQESFKMHQMVKQKINSTKDYHREANKQNNQNNNNKNSKQVKREEINHCNQILLRAGKLIQQKNSPDSISQISFKEAKQQKPSSNKKIGQQIIILPSESILQNNLARQKLSQKQQQRFEKKISKQTNLEELQESPIIKKNKQFKESKYYVQPIPKKITGLEDIESITLKSDSRIIDMDLFPFDL